MDSLSNRHAFLDWTHVPRLNAKQNLRPLGRLVRLAAVAVTVFTVLSPRTASAISSVITVNSTADTATAGDGACTLREAINNANSNSDTTSGDCTSGSASTIITFNAALASELRAIGFVQKLLDEGLLKDNARGRYRRMLMHAITADKALADLSLGSKFDTEWSFLTDLRARGRQAADDSLGHCLTQVGVSSSLDLKSGFP